MFGLHFVHTQSALPQSVHKQGGHMMLNTRSYSRLFLSVIGIFADVASGTAWTHPIMHRRTNTGTTTHLFLTFDRQRFLRSMFKSGHHTFSILLHSRSQHNAASFSDNQGGRLCAHHRLPRWYSAASHHVLECGRRIRKEPIDRCYTDWNWFRILPSFGFFS